MDQSDVACLTIKGASDLLNSKQASSAELTRAVLDRIDAVEDQVKAFISVTPDLAMAQARKADKLIAEGKASRLTGIPMQLKDNISTNGVPTTCSSRMLEGYTPTYDASVASLLFQEGAVLVGKGNLDEFAMGSSTENSAFYPTHNPWELTRVPGGSSGGPAAAVAAGEALFSLGSDTGGSVRQPAALCGVVGMKPTYGLVSRYGLVAFASSLDQIGPLTKDVSDCALILNAISGHDPKDSTSLNRTLPDYTKSLGEELNGLRLGVPTEYFVSGIEPGVKESVETAINVLEGLGAHVEEFSMPSTDYALAVYYILAPSEASANLARYDGVKYGFSTRDADGMWDALEKTRGQGFGPEVKRRIMLGTYSLSAGYYDAYYLKAQKVRTVIRKEFEEAFKRFDVLVSPTSPTVAFKLGAKTLDPLEMYMSDVCTLPANIAGIPGISVPAGFVDGLPVGIQFLGKPLSEDTLLKVSYAYEQASNWHLVQPKLN